MPDYYYSYGHFCPDMQGIDCYLQYALSKCKSEEEKKEVRIGYVIGAVLSLVGSILLAFLILAAYKFIFHGWSN